MKSAGSRPAHGFTLVELMVTIVIVATLASLVFVISGKAMDRAKAASNLGNVRNLGSMVSMLSQDNGAFPPGWSFAKGQSWADLVIDQMHGDSINQDDILLSPQIAKNIDPGLAGTAISNYSVNPIIFPQEGVNGLFYRVTPARLRRPANQILLGDALPRNDEAPYGFSMVVWWGLRGQATGNSGTPPVSNEARGNTPVSLPGNIVEMTQDGGKGLPAFRSNGRGHFFFADGHVDALRPEDLKNKHFAISY
ncbi:type II secretion system protein [Haloferula rosea]|uniref:type II secretion system protein n=1 Tax=Haloferula rosea TaxID=490093 RepID=UPI00227973C4|nr:prepilin-type N-terminal cleavage/methylation domain-containing protein [Haloferula rosea]